MKPSSEFLSPLDTFFYRLIDGVAARFGHLSPQQGARIGVFLGRVLFRLHRRYRNIAMGNLKNAFPELKKPEIRAIALQVFENLGKLFYEICWSARFTEEKLRRHVRIEGLSHLYAAHAMGKGVLVLTGHFGNWELMLMSGKLFGLPISIVYRPMDFKPLEAFIVNFRTRFGARLIPKKKSFRKILDRLNQGELVGILLDQNVARREGVFAPFFNIPACTNTGMALLALKTGAPVVPMFLVREDNFHYRTVILPPLPFVNTGDKDRDVETNTAIYNQAIEDMVRKYPDQWFWVHRRWNTKPLPTAGI